MHQLNARGNFCAATIELDRNKKIEREGERNSQRGQRRTFIHGAPKVSLGMRSREIVGGITLSLSLPLSLSLSLSLCVQLTVCCPTSRVSASFTEEAFILTVYIQEETASMDTCPSKKKKKKRQKQGKARSSFFYYLDGYHTRSPTLSFHISLSSPRVRS